jgi:hypothetical protein
MLATENCPDTVKEFVTSDTKFCDWHQKNETIYPKEYASWFRLKNRNGIAEEKGGKLHIISPRNGSIFYYDASIPENQQKLVVEALGGYEERARFFVDGDFLQEKERPFLIQIGLKKGNHIILVECGDEKEYIELKVK